MKLLLVALACVFVGSVSAGATTECAACPSCDPLRNPDFPVSVDRSAVCRAKVLFILDESGSLRNFRQNVVDAAKAFWTSLSTLEQLGGAASLGLIEFADAARVVQPNLRQLNRQYVEELNAYVSSQAGGASGYSPSGRTDWGEALKLANEAFTGANTPDIVVFFTDGEPNGHDGPCDSTCYEFDQNNGDLGNACWEADKIKARGIKIFTVAVGQVVGNVPAIQVISGGSTTSIPFGDGATEWDFAVETFGRADYLIDPDVDTLQERLTRVAEALCPRCEQCVLFPTNTNPESIECVGPEPPTSLSEITYTSSGECGNPRFGQANVGFEGACRVGTITKTLALLDRCDNVTERTAGFSTRVTDTVGPVINCPPSVDAGSCEDAFTAITNLQATAVDLCSSVFVDKSGIRTITEEETVRGYEVTFTALDACENAATNTCVVQLRCADGADVKLVKSTNIVDCAISGDLTTEFQYTLTLSNLGPATARNVFVVEEFPPGGLYERRGPITVSRGTFVETPLGFTWTVGDVTRTQVETATFRIFLLPSYPAGLIENHARANTTSADPDLCNNIAEEVTRVCRESDLSVTKTDHQEVVTAGATLEGSPRVYAYEIEIVNNGPSDAANVRVVDEFPEGFLLGNNLRCDGGSCFKTPEGFSCRIPNIPVGERRVIISTYTVPACSLPGPRTNTVHVASDSTDSNPDNNHAHDVTTIRTEADIAVTKDDEVDSVTAGGVEVQTYVIRVTNNGPSCAREVRVVDTWPLGLERVADTLTTSQGHCINLGGGSFSCNVGTLEVGQVVRIQASYTAPASLGSCEVRNIVNVDSTTYDPITCNNDAKDTNAVAERAVLSITKTSTPFPSADGTTRTLALGDTRPYWFVYTVTNQGPSTARQVQLSDLWPVQLTQFRETLIASQGGCVTTGGDFTCQFGDLPAGQTITIRIKYSLSELAEVGTFTNEAVAFSPTDTQCRVTAFRLTVTQEKKRAIDHAAEITVDSQRSGSKFDITLQNAVETPLVIQRLAIRIGDETLSLTDAKHAARFEDNTCSRLLGANLVKRELKCTVSIKGAVQEEKVFFLVNGVSKEL